MGDKEEPVDYQETLTSSYVKWYLTECKDSAIKKMKHLATIGVMGLTQAFRRHPAEVGQSYCAHFVESAKNAGRKMKEACALLSHGVFPFMGTHVSYATIYTPKLKPMPEVEISDRVLDALELATLDIVADTERIRKEIIVTSEIKEALQGALSALAQRKAQEATTSLTPPAIADVKKWE